MLLLFIVIIIQNLQKFVKKYFIVGKKIPSEEGTKPATTLLKSVIDCPPPVTITIYPRPASFLERLT
tara:strand:+ start:171 stop:371 length:201 start_codon:yes stop_codon:yes gene_type:complete